MKNNTQTKSITFYLVFLLTTLMVLGASSCDNHNNTNADGTQRVAESENNSNAATPPPTTSTANASAMQDSQFLIKVAEINMEEIKLGELAQSKAMMADVKSLGKMMVDAHTKAHGELKGLAAQKTVSLPAASTEKIEEAYKDLNEKKGADFDEEYTEMMVEGHKNAINEFEKASMESTDADIKAWATKMLPDLRMHLDHSMKAKELVENKGKKTSKNKSK